MGLFTEAALSALIGFVLAASSGDANAPLRLRCEGRGTGASESDAVHLLSRGGLSTTRAFRETHFDAAVLVELKDGAARVHLPSALVTRIHSGGEDGWWPASELKLGEDVITGRLRLNLVNKPTFRIDRTTGDIDIDGAYPFHGVCEKAAAVERKF